MTEIENLYAVLGGRFITPESEIRRKLHDIKVFLLDWDGVFNNGEKSIHSNGSSFSEVDSMGLNLLRFSWFLKHGDLPVTGIISGERNANAFHFSERECLHYSFYKIPHKHLALDYICNEGGFKPHEVAYFFDDVLDLSIAERCGVRVLVNQKCNPQFTSWCIKHQLVDYLTASPGGSGAVRESTELLIGLQDNFEAVIENRMHNSPRYQEYITRRKAIQPSFFTLTPKGIEPLRPE